MQLSLYGNPITLVFVGFLWVPPTGSLIRRVNVNTSKTIGSVPIRRNPIRRNANPNPNPKPYPLTLNHKP